MAKKYKYKVFKHKYLPLTIVHFINKSVIYPAQIECSPDTKIEDILVIDQADQK
jgi:hypothetical protein